MEINHLFVNFSGDNLEDHFLKITLKHIRPYIKLADHLKDLIPPPIPTSWPKEAGWFKHNVNGQVEKVDFPDEDALVFDVETLVNGNYPVMATALSKNGWCVFIAFLIHVPFRIW